jgi:hypothetical protein
LWIPATRIALKLQGPQDPLYQAVIAAGKARADALANTAAPAPVVKDSLTTELEPLETELEPIE